MEIRGQHGRAGGNLRQKESADLPVAQQLPGTRRIEHFELQINVDRPQLRLQTRSAALHINWRFVLDCQTSAEVEDRYALISEAHFQVDTPPWDAFWAQRYAQ